MTTASALDTNNQPPTGEAVHCNQCQAVCCRLTVVVTAADKVPAHLLERTLTGLDVMARDQDGWCRALDRGSMRCGIYEQRPDGCRRFVMGGGYCRSAIEAYVRAPARRIPLRLLAS